MISKGRNLRLRTKLLVTYIVLTVVPMGLLGYIAYFQYSKSIEEQAGHYIPEILEQVNENITNQINEIILLPDYIYSSNQVIGVLRKETTQPRSSQLQDEFIVNSFLNRTYINGTNPDILGVFLFSHERSFYSTKVPFSELDFNSLTNPTGVANAVESPPSNKGNTILLPHQTSLSFQDDRPFILLIRHLTDYENRKNLGTIAIAIEVNFISHALEELSKEETATLWMMDHNGHIIYHTDDGKIGSKDLSFEDYPKINGSFKSIYEEDSKLISLDFMEEQRWFLAHSIPVKHLTEQTDLVRNVTIIIFIILVLISLVLSIILAWNVSSPLNRLMLSMRRLEKGDFSTKLSVDREDEMGILAKNFNRMTKEIDELIREKYQIQLKQKEAELVALQSQINPHFMYNTLETISMAVEEDEKDTVVQMVTILGRMLRFSIHNKENLISIETEVGHMKDYLTIQKIRFEHCFDFQIRYADDLQHQLTPKLILQPVVENVIKHALNPNKMTSIDITIELEKKSEEDHILIKISDNGKGMKRERLLQLQRELLHDPMKKRDSNFGLVNVHGRIQIQFGAMFGLHINSQENIGTSVEIRIPILEGGKENEN